MKYDQIRPAIAVDPQSQLYEVPNKAKPFSASSPFMRQIERTGMALRDKAQVIGLDRINPVACAKAFGCAVVSPDDLPALPSELRNDLAKLTTKDWSGGCIEISEGFSLILLQPNQTPERAAVTILEEVAHIYLKHPRTQITIEGDKVARRNFNPQQEQQAYWSAAAALLPSIEVAKTVWDRAPIEALARRHGASVELAQFRIKVLNLWKFYQPSESARRAG